MMAMFLAYIDPGSGSLLAQLLFGGVAGLAALVKFRWGSIRRFFVRRAAGAQVSED